MFNARNYFGIESVFELILDRLSLVHSVIACPRHMKPFSS